MGDTKEDADGLHKMLAAGEVGELGDPVSIAMTNMFQRDDQTMPLPHPDGSLDF